MRVVLAASFSLASLVACSAPDTSLAPTSGRVASTDSTSAAMTAGNPAEVLTRGGTYWFSFDESPTVLAMMTDRCAKQEADAAKADACVDAIREQGAREAIRFSGTDAQHLTWTSFGIGDDGKEELFLEMPFAVTRVDGATVHVKATGPARGPQAEGMKGKAPPSDSTFEVVDGVTIAMIDPAKGRLVFRAR